MKKISIRPKIIVEQILPIRAFLTLGMQEQAHMRKISIISGNVNLPPYSGFLVVYCGWAMYYPHFGDAMEFFLTYPIQ